MRWAIVGALVLGVGCGGEARGGSEAEPGSVTGTVGGNAIPTTSVIGVNQGGTTGDFVVALVFVNVAAGCSLLQSNRDLRRLGLPDSGSIPMSSYASSAMSEDGHPVSRGVRAANL